MIIKFKENSYIQEQAGIHIAPSWDLSLHFKDEHFIFSFKYAPFTVDMPASSDSSVVYHPIKWKTKLLSGLFSKTSKYYIIKCKKHMAMAPPKEVSG